MLRSKHRDYSSVNVFIAVAVAVSVLIVGYILTVGMAAGSTVAVEPGVDNGNLGKAKLISDPQASGGRALQFGQRVSTPPTPPNGTLLWQDKPDSPIGTKAISQSQWLENWLPAPYNIRYGGSISVVADPVKGKAIEFFGRGGVHGDDGYNPYQRAELVPDLNDLPGGGGSSLVIGKTYWFGFDLWIGRGVGISRNHSLIWQIKQDPDAGSPNIEFSLQRHQEGLHMLTADGGNYQLGPVPVEQWTRFVIGAKITNGSDSWVEVYRDGQVKVPRTTLSSGMVQGNPKWAYMKTGTYHGPQSWDLRIRMANYKIGTTKEIVQ